MIYTVGNEKIYDSGISRFGVEYRKLGRVEGKYAGGFAVQTLDDAWRLVVEQGRVGIWAVYEVDAVWERDTTPSQNGWWHALLVDSVIVRKVIDSQGNAVV